MAAGEEKRVRRKSTTAKPVLAEQKPEGDATGAIMRPRRLQDFIGQEQLRRNLTVFIDAALSRKEPLDHCLLYGPPGLGKTTLSQIIAAELGVRFKYTSGPALTRAGDLASILASLRDRDVLFIDEIHRLPAAVEEGLYSAMEDFQLPIILGKGPVQRRSQYSSSHSLLLAQPRGSGCCQLPFATVSGSSCDWIPTTRMIWPLSSRMLLFD